MKKLLLKLKKPMLFLFLSSMASFSQEKCATDKMTEIERNKNPEIFKKNRAKLEEFTRSYSLEKRTSGFTTNEITKIPTIIHVMHNGEAVGTYPNISDVQLLSAIENLNDAFKNQGSIYNDSDFYNSPMNIEFVLAKVKEDGAMTTGIERHDVSGKSYAELYKNDGISGGVSGVDSALLFKDFYWNPQDYMNIWIVNKIDGVDIGTNENGTLGYASLPKAFPGVTDGLVCQARAFGYNLDYNPSNPSATPGFDFGEGETNASGNGTADHEVGHYLNLLHTFTGDQNETTCPPLFETEIGVDGDGCDDIPPHIRTNSICPDYSGTANTCVTPSGPNEYIHNFMNYSSDPCFTGFSNDQRTRVHATIDGPRSAFKTSIGHVSPSDTYPAPVVNKPVISEPGEFSLGIFEVTLNGTTYKSINAYNDGYYINRVASQPTTTLVKNTTYTMTIKVGVDNTSNYELVDVYIDYNNDGDFNITNERIYQTAGGEGKMNGETFSFSFTTPTTTIDNQKLRMRVISDFDDNHTIPSTFTTQAGNIEDYSVIFNPTLSIDTNIIPEDISIYSNQTNDILNISNATSNQLTSIFIYDILGRQVFKGSNSDKISIDQLTKGVYLLKLEFNNHTVITKRFVKKQ